MQCKQLNKNIIGYIEKTIPVNLQSEMEKHFNECLPCKKLYDNVFSTYTVYDAQPKAEVNPFFYTRLVERLETQEQSAIKPVPKLIWKLQPIAAGILIIVGISMGILIGNSLSGSSITLTSPNRTEILEAYATDYYLTDTNDNSVNALINNE